MNKLELEAAHKRLLTGTEECAGATGMSREEMAHHMGAAGHGGGSSCCAYQGNVASNILYTFIASTLKVYIAVAAGSLNMTAATQTNVSH